MTTCLETTALELTRIISTFWNEKLSSYISTHRCVTHCVTAVLAAKLCTHFLKITKNLCNLPTPSCSLPSVQRHHLSVFPELRCPIFISVPQTHTHTHTHHIIHTTPWIQASSQCYFLSPWGAEGGLMRQTGQMMLLLLKNIQSVLNLHYARPLSNKRLMTTWDKSHLKPWKWVSVSAENTCSEMCVSDQQHPCTHQSTLKGTFRCRPGSYCRTSF